MTVWTEKLQPSEVRFVNDILEQIPQEMGGRTAFVTILQKLADSGNEPLKFRFLIAGIIAGMCDVRGTNDAELAREAAVDEENYVVDVQTITWLCDGDPESDSAILEHQP